MSRLHKLHRRAFLTALGLGISAPLALRMSKLASASVGPRPKRLFILFIPHGIPLEHFDPVTDGGEFNLKAKGIGGLSPLEPYKKYVTMIRGIGMADGAMNHPAIRAALTGFQEGGTVDSIDYVIAEALKTTPHALGAIPYKASEGFSADSHLMKHGGAWVRALESPVDAKAELFAGIQASPASVDEAAFRAKAVALTAKQVDRMKKGLAGLTSEENKLAIHLEALQSLKAD